jgi:hypothetical protein
MFFWLFDLNEVAGRDFRHDPERVKKSKWQGVLAHPADRGLAVESRGNW